MRLAHPWALAALALVAAAAWWEWRGGASRRASLPFPGAAPARRGPMPLLARWGPVGLRAAALALVVLALARPQKVRARLPESGRGIDIMLVLDTSTSMNALDFEPGNRLQAAKDAARRFILGRVQDRIGLSFFGGASVLACPLTIDYDALTERLGEMAAGMTGAEGTAIGDGIVSGVNHLKGSSAKSKVMILLTDGRSNTGLIDPLTAAKTARALGIKIYAIGTAKKGESLMPVDDPRHGRVMVRIADDLDEETLAEVARITDGRFYRAESLQQLKEIYAAIDSLEKSEVKLQSSVSFDDLYRWPLGAAALLLFLELSLSNTLFLRWP